MRHLHGVCTGGCRDPEGFFADFHLWEAGAQEPLRQGWFQLFGGASKTREPTKRKGIGQAHEELTSSAVQNHSFLDGGQELDPDVSADMLHCVSRGGSESGTVRGKRRSRSETLGRRREQHEVP